jgi:hypothetical protein
MAVQLLSACGDHAADGLGEGVRVEGLVDGAVRFQLIHGGVSAIGGEEQDGHLVAEGPYLAVESAAVHTRHLEVQDDGIEGSELDLLEAVEAIGGGCDEKAFRDEDETN